MMLRKIIGIVVVENRRIFVRMGHLAFFIDRELIFLRVTWQCKINQVTNVVVFTGQD